MKILLIIIGLVAKGPYLAAQDLGSSKKAYSLLTNHLSKSKKCAEELPVITNEGIKNSPKLNILINSNLGREERIYHQNTSDCFLNIQTLNFNQKGKSEKKLQRSTVVTKIPYKSNEKGEVIEAQTRQFPEKRLPFDALELNTFNFDENGNFKSSTRCDMYRINSSKESLTNLVRDQRVFKCFTLTAQLCTGILSEKREVATGLDFYNNLKSFELDSYLDAESENIEFLKKRSLVMLPERSLPNILDLYDTLSGREYGEDMTIVKTRKLREFLEHERVFFESEEVYDRCSKLSASNLLPSVEQESVSEGVKFNSTPNRVISN